jgi:1-deoxy-D-xylulose-5-phosphate reductoisomerase
MKRIAILGSTGSIGRSTLSVAESYPDRFEIVTLAAGSNVDAAFEQGQRWRPRLISIASEADAGILRKRLKQAGLNEIEVVHGAAGTRLHAQAKRLALLIKNAWSRLGS